LGASLRARLDASYQPSKCFLPLLFKIRGQITGKIVHKTDEDVIIVTKAWKQEYRTLPNKSYVSRAHWGINKHLFYSRYYLIFLNCNYL
jgi:hypothetical protein